MSVYFALLMWVTGGKSIYNLPDWWSSPVVFFQFETASGDLVRITTPLVVMALVAVATWFLMNRTTAGRQLYAVGGNEEAARRVGINITAMHFLAYGYLGLMAGLAGPGPGQPGRRERAERDGRRRAQRAGGGGARRGEPERRHRHGAGRAARHPAAGDAAERPQPARRLALLLPDRDRRRHPGLDLGHRALEPARTAPAGARRRGARVPEARPPARPTPASRGFVRSLRGGAPGGMAGLLVLLIALVGAVLAPDPRPLPDRQHAAVGHVPAARSSGSWRSRW